MLRSLCGPPAPRSPGSAPTPAARPPFGSAIAASLGPKILRARRAERKLWFGRPMIQRSANAAQATPYFRATRTWVLTAAPVRLSGEMRGGSSKTAPCSKCGSGAPTRPGSCVCPRAAQPVVAAAVPGGRSSLVCRGTIRAAGHPSNSRVSSTPTSTSPSARRSRKHASCGRACRSRSFSALAPPAWLDRLRRPDLRRG